MSRLLMIIMIVAVLPCRPASAQELQWTWEPIGGDPDPNKDPIPNPFIRVTIWLCGIRNLDDFMLKLNLGSTIVPVTEASYHPPFKHPDHFRQSGLLEPPTHPLHHVISWSRFLGEGDIFGPAATTWCPRPVVSFTVLNIGGTAATSTLAIDGTSPDTFFTDAAGPVAVNFTTANLVTGEVTNTDACFCLFADVDTFGRALFIPSQFPFIAPLAILGSEQMEAANIDVGSLRLGPFKVLMLRRSQSPAAAVVDVNGDQINDLLVLFRTFPGAFHPDEKEAHVTGRLIDKTLIEGKASIFAP